MGCICDSQVDECIDMGWRSFEEGLQVLDGFRVSLDIDKRAGKLVEHCIVVWCKFIGPSQIE